MSHLIVFAHFLPATVASFGSVVQIGLLTDFPANGARYQKVQIVVGSLATDAFIGHVVGGAQNRRHVGKKAMQMNDTPQQTAATEAFLRLKKFRIILFFLGSNRIS